MIPVKSIYFYTNRTDVLGLTILISVFIHKSGHIFPVYNLCQGYFAALKRKYCVIYVICEIYVHLITTVTNAKCTCIPF